MRVDEGVGFGQADLFGLGQQKEKGPFDELLKSGDPEEDERREQQTERRLKNKAAKIIARFMLLGLIGLVIYAVKKK